ncbi:MAG TPA: TonB-dependent receptor [Terriglobales bacterium]|nr:TonB-dependent receptor [Terriglobales bacterium]
MKLNAACPVFSLYRWLISALAFTLLLGSAAAQRNTGIIGGHVADREGAVLQGARVTLEPGDITGATNGQGEFTFIGLLPGDYSLTVSYVGFATFAQQVKVTAGQTTRVEAKMVVAATGTEVTVVADAYGVDEAINQQRTSDNILNVMPKGVIQSLPNANIADVTGRMPGVSLERDEGEGKYVQVRGTEPRLTNTTVDGVELPAPEDNVRQFKLDTIPSNIVGSVELNKTLSPNQDAEAIGGTVNLVTKKAGDLPTLQVEGFGGFTPIQDTRYLGLLTGTAGMRFGADQRFGALFSGSYDYNGRGIDDIEPSPNDTSVPSYGSMDIREYRYSRQRLGFGGSLDYKLKDPTSGVFLHYFYSQFKDYGEKWAYTLSDGGAPEFSTSSRLPDYGTAAVILGGKHVLSNSWISWEVSAARSYQAAAAGNPGATFDPIPGTPASNLTSCVNLPSSNYRFPQWSPSCFGSPTYDPNQYTITEYDGTQGITSQVNLQGAMSYARNYHLGSRFSTFEFGFMVRNAHKGQDAYSAVYDQTFIPNPSNPPISPMTDYLSGFRNPNYYFGKYPLGPVTDYNKIVGNLNNLINQGVLAYDGPATIFGSALSNFDLTERISAGYAMNTIEFGRVRLQAGLRIEATQLDILGYAITNNPNSTAEQVVPQYSNSWYWDPLPVVQFRYRLTDNSNLRASYGRGISRPNPYDMVPYVTVDQSTNPYTIDIGNPQLKPEHANNYDVLYEHYLKPYGAFQGGFFYKQLSQPIYYILDPHYQGTQYPQYVGDNFSYIINGGHADLYGVELAYSQHLGFLPGALSGFGMTANFTKIGSSAGSLPLRTDNPALQRQNPTIWNLGPTYDRGRFAARLGLTYNGASIYQYQWQQCTASQTQLGICEDPANLGPKGPLGDNYLYAHLQLDAQASIRVQKSLTVLWQGLNLTNEVFGFYNGSQQYVTQREFYKPSYSFGLRWEPRREY